MKPHLITTLDDKLQLHIHEDWNNNISPIFAVSVNEMPDTLWALEGTGITKSIDVGTKENIPIVDFVLIYYVKMDSLSEELRNKIRIELKNKIQNPLIKDGKISVSVNNSDSEIL